MCNSICNVYMFEDPTDQPDPDMMWSYRSWRDLDGFPTLGFFATYSGGGYRAEFGT